jgi:ABC-type polysaccharide/polyol phosphate transport system ATPase subunit
MTTRTAEQVAVAAEEVSKVYEVGGRSRYEPVTPLLHRLRGHTALGSLDAADDEDDDEGAPEEEAEEFSRGDQKGKRIWALRDVSIDIQPGVVFGVFGDVNSGKTTLLRVLAGALRPTQGRVVCRGRIGPIPDLARLFMRPDRPARQNVLAVARYAGSPGALSNRDADEIVRFVNGAHREAPAPKALLHHLALATVLFLEPDVLFLDDLAFAEGEFRERCLERIDARRGKAAVVLASRDTTLLGGLCSEGVLLESGSVVARGSIADLVRVRDERLHGSASASVRGFSHLGAIVGAGIEDLDGSPRRRFRWDEDVVVRLALELRGGGELVRCALRLRAGRQNALSARQPEPYVCTVPGVVSVRARIPGGSLAAESYAVDVEASIADGALPVRVVREHAASFAIDSFPDLEQSEGADPDPPEEDLELVEMPISSEVQWTVDAERQA